MCKNTTTTSGDMTQCLKILNHQKEIFKDYLAVDKIAQILRVSRKSNKRGRPRKFGLFQITACLVYNARNSITSFRELEYKINENGEFRRVMGSSKKSLNPSCSSKACSNDRRKVFSPFKRSIDKCNKSRYK